MIHSIHNTVSFGNSTITEAQKQVEKAQETKKEIMEGALGTTGAVAVANGNKMINAGRGIFQKSSKIVGNVPNNSKTFKQFMLGTMELAEKTRGLKWIARFAKWGPVKFVSGALGGLAAVGLCATDLANMVNVGARMYDTGRVPVLDNFASDTKPSYKIKRDENGLRLSA